MSTNPLIVLILLVILSFSSAAHYNAKEAHKHLHEIGCSLKIPGHCQWLSGEDDE